MTLDWILARADEHSTAHGEWPYQIAGAIDGTDETWSNVDSALRIGRRGLPGGSSLAKVLAEHRRVKPRGSATPLTLDWILARMDEHRAAHGEWPRYNSGAVDGTNDTWSNVDRALMGGWRGLSGGSSLAKLLEERRGVKPAQIAKTLTEEWILARMDEHRDATGEWPRRLSGPIAETGLTWCAVDSALRGGYRGLPGGSSLAKLRAEHGRGKRVLTFEWVIAKANEYREAHGRLPNTCSGPIQGAGGLTWNAVQQALAQGRRGLSGGSSLHKLLRKSGRI